MLALDCWIAVGASIRTDYSRYRLIRHVLRLAVIGLLAILFELIGIARHHAYLSLVIEINEHRT